MTTLEFKNIRLPRKPSALIRVAVDDLEKCERDSRYRVNVLTWHEPGVYKDRPVCFVCLAGGVIAQRTEIAPHIDVVPSDFPQETRRKLEALNFFRVGRVASGLRRMGIDPSRATLRSWPRHLYDTDPAAFKQSMRCLAAALERSGM